jgi:hypothetical protein
VFDGKPERGPADAVEDEVEVAGELFDDASGAEAAQNFVGCGGIADQRGDVRAAGVGKLDRDPPDAAGDTRDQHPLAEQQAGNLQRPQRGQAGGRKRGGLHVGDLVRDRGQPVGCDRGHLRPRAAVCQANHPGARRRPAAVAGGPFDDAGDIPTGGRSLGQVRQAGDLAAVE